MSATAAVAPENTASPAVLRGLPDRDSNSGEQAGKLAARSAATEIAFPCLTCGLRGMR